jgi:hypothetical protein
MQCEFFHANGRPLITMGYFEAAGAERTSLLELKTDDDTLCIPCVE